MPRVPRLWACNLQGALQRARSDTLISEKTEKNLALGSCVNRGAVPKSATVRLPRLKVGLTLAISSTQVASTLTLVAVK
jgi:hypothetical protein